MHPPSTKLIKHSDTDVDELKEQVITVSKNCKFCREYMKPPPRPVVGLPVATSFNQCVAMDLKKYDNVHLLHLIDHATRLSACAVIKSKSPEAVIRQIFKIWISIYGYPHSFLSDNREEFSNSKFREMCEKLNINVKTTAAESPLCNGLSERHNKVLTDNIMKIMAENGCGLDIAVCWAINAKNSLQNVHGYSPFQLVFGQNPRLPSILYDKPPALDDITTTKIIRDNLNALHKARQAFVTSESSEKIRRALRHNVRTSGDIKYFTGDKVYYMRRSKNKWQGPAVVLGQDGQQVLVKHGGIYIRVHPCSLKLEEYPSRGKIKANYGEKLIDCSKANKIDSRNDNVHSQNFDEQSSSEESDNEKEENDTEINRNKTITMEPNDQHIVPGDERDKDQNYVDNTDSTRQYTGVLRKGMHVKYKINDDGDDWYKAKLLSRSGKASGKYKNEWNVENDIEGRHVVDFDFVDE